MNLLHSILRRPRPDDESWSEVGGKLVDAIAALVRAEASGLEHDIRSTWSTVRRLVVRFAIGVGLCVFALAALLAAAIIGLSQLVHPGVAALGVGLVLALIAAYLLTSARRSVSSLESPVQTLRRRLDSHLEWWKDEVKSVGRVERRSDEPSEAARSESLDSEQGRQ